MRQNVCLYFRIYFCIQRRKLWYKYGSVFENSSKSGPSCWKLKTSDSIPNLCWRNFNRAEADLDQKCLKLRISISCRILYEHEKQSCKLEVDDKGPNKSKQRKTKASFNRIFFIDASKETPTSFYFISDTVTWILPCQILWLNIKIVIFWFVDFVIKDWRMKRKAMQLVFSFLQSCKTWRIS